MMKRLFLTLVLLLLTACQTQQGARMGKASSGGGSAFSGQGIDGTWQGVIIHGSQILHIQLNLAPAADLPPQLKSVLSSQTSNAQTAQMYEGMAYAQDFSGYLAKHDITKDIASESMPVYGVFDPQLRTFRLFPKPQARARMGRLGLEFHLRNLGGVHDQREDVLAGLKPSQVGATQAPNSGDQHFFLTRPSRFKDEAKSFDPSVSWVPSLGPSRSDLTQWLQPFFTEYPGANLYQAVHGRLELAAIKLFRDDHFKKYFGDPFDELSSTQLKNIHRTMQNPGGRDVTDQSIVALNRMFWVGRGDNAAAQTALWVKAQRHMLHWRQDQLTALPRLPGLKSSLEHIDQVELELAKVAPALLWPSELKGDKAQLLHSRQAIAYPALRTMLAEFEAATPSLNLMNKVASWQADERRLFGYLPSDQAHALRASANQRLTAIVTALLPSYRQRLAASGAGLPAVLAGANWHRDFTRDFALVANHPLVQETLHTFAAQRAQHLNQAQAEMLAKIREGHAQLPSDLSPPTDAKRMRYCATLKQLDAAWFAVPSDATQAAVSAVRQSMAQYGGLAAGLLPPRLAGTTGFQAQIDGGEDVNLNLYRSKVVGDIAQLGTLADDDAAARQALPKPIRDANLVFASNVVWALFHGRFDELDNQHYKGGGMGSDIVGQIGNVNPRVHYALVTYAGLSSIKNGWSQVGPASTLSWTSRNSRTGDVVREGWGEIKIADALRPFYAHSYKVAESASSSDALFGNNPLGFLETFLRMGTGGVFAKSTVRPDGEFQLNAADWEKPIREDLGNLLGAWPGQSHGLWQFQENLVRYLKQRPSLQALYGYQ